MNYWGPWLMRWVWPWGLVVISLLAIYGLVALSHAGTHGGHGLPQDLQPTPRSLTLMGEWHSFCWDHDLSTADWYQVKIARPGESWETLAVIQAPTLCWYGDVETFPPGLVGIVITASNAAGVSDTEHGSYYGWTP